MTTTIKEAAAPTAAVLAYGKLRGDILRGVLVPLERLRVNDTSERYGCGAIPMREALNRLAAEHLVVHSEQRGFAVAPISAEGLRDLAKARSMLVEVAMREALLNGDAAWEERVLLSYHRLSKVPRYLSLEPRTPNPAYDGPHREFHSALISGCGSQWVVSLCERLFDHAERYRNLSRKIMVAPREDEHKMIVDAALARRLDETVALSKRHVEITAEIILQQPESDIG
jgi:GntR family transcriptional regulator, carbon starvation induced regulator